MKFVDEADLDGSAGMASVAPAAAPAAASTWIVLLALAMGGFAIGTTEFAAMTLVPYFSKGLGIDVATAGHVISAYALGVVVGAPLIAVFGARLPRRTLLIGLMVVYGIANVASALSPTYHWMLAFRFMSGLPHGAYFGVASLVAASLVEPNRRAQAVACTMLGLTVATIVGVPMATLLGQMVGWRWGFGIVGLLALTTVVLVALYAPRDKGDPAASPLRELTALARGQVWLTLGIGAIGFGGMFAVYTYTASTLLDVTRVQPEIIPAVFAVFGIGMTVGTLAAAWAADRALMLTIGAILVQSLVTLLLFHVAAGQLWSIALVMFFVGWSGGLGIVLQTRLMDVAGDAQTLAAALNHSAFNTANALGPMLGGMAITAGYGLTSTGWVGAALSACGIVIWATSWALDRERAR